MKKITIILVVIMFGRIPAQTLYSNGANVTLNGALLQVNGSVLNKGQFNLKQTSQMVVKGDIDNLGKLSNDGHIDLYGNLWSATKIDNPLFGEWSLLGSSIQSLTSDSTIVTKNIVLNNPAGFLADVKNDIKVTNTANFVRGVLETLSATRMLFGSTASHSNSSDTSHVKGLVAKEGTGGFIYPVGTGTKLQDVFINASSNPTAIQVAYKSGDAGSALFGIAGAQATPLQSYNNAEYWEMVSGGAQGTVNMTHDAHNGLTIPALNDVRVARKDGSQWLNQGGTATGTVNSATVASLSSTLDGNFTLGIVKKDIMVSIHNPSGKTSICPKDTLVIYARRVLGVNEFSTATSFTISPANASLKVNDTTFKLFPSTTTQFVLTGTDQNNLEGIVNFNLGVNSLPNVTAVIKNPIVVNGKPLNIWPKDQSVELEAKGAVSYAWSPSTFVIGGTINSTLISVPSSHITYSVIGTDVNGCKNTASVAIRAFIVKSETSSSCTSIVWRGRTISKAGFYGDTVASSAVDTIFALNFTSNAANIGVAFENGQLASQCMDCQYQWYACKPDGTFTAIENAKSRVLPVKTIGTYSVEVSNGLCSAKSPCVSNVSSAIVAGDVFEGIAVYPNPFVDNIKVQLDKDPVSAYIQIVDLNGRVVHSKRVTRVTETTLNLSSIAQGSYFIQIVFDKQDKKMYYTKIVKE